MLSYECGEPGFEVVKISMCTIHELRYLYAVIWMWRAGEVGVEAFELSVSKWPNFRVFSTCLYSWGPCHLAPYVWDYIVGHWCLERHLSSAWTLIWWVLCWGAASLTDHGMAWLPCQQWVQSHRRGWSALDAFLSCLGHLCQGRLYCFTCSEYFIFFQMKGRWIVLVVSGTVVMINRSQLLDVYLMSCVLDCC